MADLREKIQNALDECRMLILGGQVLISFSAEAALQPGFTRLSGTAQTVGVVGMIAMVLGVGVHMWPAAYHVIVCRGEDRLELLRFTNRALCFGLMPFAGGIGATLWIVGERTGGAAVGVALAATGAVAAVVAWYGFPMTRRRGRRRPENDMETGTTPISDKIRHVLTEARMVLPGAQALLGSARSPC